MPIAVTVETVRIASTGSLVKRLGVGLGREVAAVAVAGTGCGEPAGWSPAA
jgi:hypothetical protein